MNLSEDLITTVLKTLELEYPNMVETSRYPRIDTPDAHRIMFYLAEKDLIKAGEISERGKFPEMLEAKITAKGLDYLDNPVSSHTLQSNGNSIFDTKTLRDFVIHALSSSQLDNQSTQLAIEKLLTLDQGEMDAFAIKLLQIAVRDTKSIMSILIENENN